MIKKRKILLIFGILVFLVFLIALSVRASVYLQSLRGRYPYYPSPFSSSLTGPSSDHRCKSWCLDQRYFSGTCRMECRSGEVESAARFLCPPSIYGRPRCCCQLFPQPAAQEEEKWYCIVCPTCPEGSTPSPTIPPGYQSILTIPASE